MQCCDQTPILCSPFEVDSDVQLVCKYLNAYDKKDDPIHGINRLYELPPGGYSVVIGC